MKLTIKNIDKIFGRQLYSKWIPATYGWAVRHVEILADTYCFELVCNGTQFNKFVTIQLGREPTFNQQSTWIPGRYVREYELWGFDYTKIGKSERMWCKIEQINTIEEMGLRLSMMLGKIIPKDTI
jgi:hypothetical protein